MPTTSEVAALIVGDLSETNVESDVIVEHKSDGLQRISDLNPSFMAMQYPILFPYGEDGYHLGIPCKCNEGRRQTKRHCVTMREYYAYRIQQRENESQTIIRGGRLFQQFLVDAFTAIEEERLRWIRNNQLQLRAELYKGFRDAVVRGDTTPSSVGRRIILPSSFTGGPRYMIQNYQDAMAICRWTGNPDLFITFIVNPKWLEIQKFVDQIPGQKPANRPDIESRVFKIKLDQLMRDLIKLQHFGRVIAAVYTIEFQKRGLPHAHILLWLHQSDKYPTSSEIDKIILAEIPDETSDYTAYAAVAEFMMHGPCGAANNKAPCMIGGNYCSKKFPKFFYTETTLSDDGFPVYRRRDNYRFVKSDKISFKYINKGPDRTTMIVKDDISRNPRNDNREIQRIDEIKSYLDCRYVSACEACWRIFQFDIQHRTPAVERMVFHLPDEQCITFRDSEPINQVLNKEDVETTMFTQWMHTNSVEEGLRSYEEIRTVNGVIHPTFKLACFSLGLLDGDKEWHDAINEASQWATAGQLRELFVTLLLFCEIANPFELWERNWQLLSDDIQFRQRHAFGHAQLELNEYQIQSYTLFEIENILMASLCQILSHSHCLMQHYSANRIIDS
ncbi:uncharacterized protein LOC143850629 [Tasmannia lanceolata]|uniref:uncharacterized protein LOC143850629 n=1 Tax=Tasmannia lanceolata TaxID=3420 RepID=UPI00406361F2